MKKKLFAVSIFAFLFLTKSWACSGWGYYDRYSSIFSQELINDERYLPFLWDPYSAYYEREEGSINRNIEEWQRYLNISYENAYYLVFKADKNDIVLLLDKKRIPAEELNFATPQFIAKYKDALEYLKIAKEMEPYMCISGAFEESWDYYDGETLQTVDDLDYDLHILQLQGAYKKAEDKEIKLRYGYQLVRLAHYKRKYNESMVFFDQYVQPLNLKSEIYYYALSQYAGAVRGAGDIITANSLYFKVFANSSDLKEIALTSINFSENVDFERFMRTAQTLEEKNDAYLLLGFISFSNPLVSAEKIIDRSPDAIQAKVLLARALAEIEDGIIDPYIGWNTDEITEYKDRRYPIVEEQKLEFLQSTLKLVTRQTDNEQLKDRDFWYLAAAYLHYLDRNYAIAENNLNKVQSKDVRYKEQKDILALITDVGKETTITDDVERRLFDKYKDILTGETVEQGVKRATFFVRNILANRYYNQKDYAKSFMIHNSLHTLDLNPQMELLDMIEAFVRKGNKNPYETYLCTSFKVGSPDDETTSVLDYIAYMKGILYLATDDLDQALEEFNASKYMDNRDEWIKCDVFGYNSIECFSCDDNMKTDYLNEFPYIGTKEVIGEKELVEILKKLKNEAINGGEKGAKANYLLGNFFYNVTTTGYYRKYLRFGYSDSKRNYFFNEKEKNHIYNNLITMEYIPTYFENRVDIANDYLEQAYKSASDNELKARIAFALSKCEQEIHYQNFSDSYQGWRPHYEDNWVMISNRKYFGELMKYRNTEFFDEVYTNCLYFEYYVNHVAE